MPRGGGGLTEKEGRSFMLQFNTNRRPDDSRVVVQFSQLLGQRVRVPHHRPRPLAFKWGCLALFTSISTCAYKSWGRELALGVFAARR